MSDFIPQVLTNAVAKGNNLGDRMIKDPKLFAEKILKSEAVTCSITIPVQQHTNQGTNCITTTIPFYMSNNFSIGNLENKWSDLVDMNGGNVFTDWMNVLNAVDSRSQVTMQSEAMSAKVWKGSSFGGFNVECLFVSTRRTINPTKIIRILASAALPDKLRKGDITTTQSWSDIKTALGGNEDTGGNQKGLFKLISIGFDTITNKIDEFTGWDNSAMRKSVSKAATQAGKLLDDVGMIAPLYYGVDLDPETNGNRPIGPIANTTLTLQIGDWFRAEELLVTSISGIQFSKEIIAPPTTDGKSWINGKGSSSLYDNSPNGSDYGYPLWGKCSINLIPFSMMHKEKFNSYFIDKEYDSVMGILKGFQTSVLGETNSIFDLPS